MSEVISATRSVIVEREMPHSPEKIWRALTQGALLEEWLMENDFQPIVGHRFTFRAASTPHWSGVVECEVLSVEPNRLLSYSWSAGGVSGLKTIVKWTLTPTPNGVLLRMEQSGFRPEDEGAHQGARYGWQRFLTRLEKMLESHYSIDNRSCAAQIL